MSESFDISTGFARPVRVHAAAVGDLGSVPAQAGWYAWFHVPNSVSEESLGLYRHFAVAAEVKGIFNLSFAGALQPANEKAGSFSEFEGDVEYLETLKSLYWAFAPPLYVGISNNLHGRLNTHRRQLLEFVSSATSSEAQEVDMDKAAADTEQESRFFAGRVGQALKTLRLSPDSLFVKCVVADPSNAHLIKQIEQALNYSLAPHYGRR
jgi:hypothetical protein